MAKSPRSKRYLAYRQERVATQVINRKERHKERRESNQRKARLRTQKMTAEAGVVGENGQGKQNKNWGKTDRCNWRTKTPRNHGNI